ncbi:MAG TPA: hypothetical protein VFF13_06945 [archaeon]|nr:hypothetical protein [archaeon]
MVNGKSVSLQKVLKRLENIDSRLKRLEKKRVIGEIELTEEENEELDNIEKEMKAGREYSMKEVFRK